MHRHDFEPEGFHWIDCSDREQSVLAFLRLGLAQRLVVVLNFTPEPRSGYRIGVPESGPLPRAAEFGFKPLWRRQPRPRDQRR